MAGREGKKKEKRNRKVNFLSNKRGKRKRKGERKKEGGGERERERDCLFTFQIRAGLLPTTGTR